MVDDGVSWQQYVDLQITALRREASLQHASTEQAIKKSDDAIASRLNHIDLGLQELANLKANERLQVERIENSRREIDNLRTASDKAITKSEDAVERRFASVNEFRAQLSDQAQRFLPREVYDSAHQDLQVRVEQLQSRLDQMAGRDSGENVIARLEQIRGQIDNNSAAIITSAGVKQGSGENKASLYAIVAAIAAVVVIVNVIIALATK